MRAKFNKKNLVITSILFFQAISAQEKINIHENTERKNEFSAFITKLKQNTSTQNVQIKRLISLGYKQFIFENGNAKQLIGVNEIGKPMYYTSLNGEASKMTKAEKLYLSGGLGLDISGQQMTIGLWDFAKPRLSHQLLSGRISYPSNQNQTISRHSTNISGTIMGNNGDVKARGIAYNAQLKAYDWMDDILEMTSEAYDPILNSNGILVANNSYGFDPIYLQSYQFGKYNTTAQNWDNLMYLKPYFQIVKAAGNARAFSPQVLPQVTKKGGYDLLEGAGIAKNVLVIASAKKNATMSTDENYDISDFSSYGPTDDGRIKPDLCAPGEDIYSSIDTYDEAYGTYKGTSSASAVVSGIITLLQQYWKSVSPNSSYMWSSTVRAILTHTANDKGTEGPDYIYGWGLVDAQRAVQAINNNMEFTNVDTSKSTLIQEKTLSQGNQYIVYVTPKNISEPLSATIAWTDPQGNLGTTQENDTSPNMINDLDLKIIKVNINGTEEITYPWKLGGINSTNSAAIKAVNNVDNIERVDVKNPDINITYKIIVSTKSKTTPLLPNGDQKFSLVISNINFCYKNDLTLVSTVNDIDVNTADQNKILKGKIITASNVIKTPVQGVEYVASDFIKLLPGFHAQAGTAFRGYLVPCLGLSTPMTYRAQVRSNNIDISIPDISDLKDNISVYPNPASEETNVVFKLANTSFVKVSLYDNSGKLISTDLSSQNFPKGNFVKTIDTSKLNTGIYTLIVETAEYKESKKLIIK